MNHKSAIHDYYAAYKNRDRTALERILDKQVQFRSPFGDHGDRDRMLEEIWPSVGRVWAVDMEIFGDGPGSIVRYRHNVSNSPTLVEHVRSQNNRIVQVDVYASSLSQQL